MSKKYLDKLQELLYDPEEEELLELRKILDKIYVDRTITIREPRSFPIFALALDVTDYCLAKCPECTDYQPIEVIVNDYWASFRCTECGEYLFFLKRGSK